MASSRAARTVPSMAAIVNLNHHASYAHWHFFQMSVPNIVVIVVMLVVFALAIVMRLPGAKRPGPEP